MVFCIVLELIQMRYNANVLAWRKERWKQETKAQIETVRAEMESRIAQERAWEDSTNQVAQGDKSAASAERITPVIIGNNVYVMMPVAGEDAASFKALVAGSATAGEAFGAPVEIGASDVQVEEVSASDPAYEVPEEK